MILENTDKVRIDQTGENHFTYIDKEWDNKFTASGEKGRLFKDMYLAKQKAHKTEGTKEYRLTWNAVLLALQYNFNNWD